MEEANNQPKTSPDEGKHKHKSKFKWILIVLIVLLLGGLGAISWFYYEARGTIDDHEATIADLRQQVDELRPAEAEEPEEEEAAANCGGGSSYSAEVGKFDLTLSDPNVIIRAVDGGFEGGPITQMTIGRCVDGETNVVDTFPTTEVNITGHPSQDSAELQSSYETRIGSSLTADSSITVDGVTAQTYTADGLFNTTLAYFDNNGIGYQIELTDTNETTEAMLDDMTSDWIFTE